MLKPALILFCFLLGVLPMAAQIPLQGKVFERAAAESGPKGEWVLYEKGVDRNLGTRRWLTKQVLVEWQPGAVAVDLSRVPGVAKATARGAYSVVAFDGPVEVALTGAERLQGLPGVRAAEPMLARQQFRRWVPNDPLFAHSPSGQGYQWHLNNTGQNEGRAGIDLKVLGAWNAYRGSGVRIGIVDDGLEWDHPDLVANGDAALGYDFNDQDDDPSPGAGDSHGTACAGVAAAVGNNGIGVVGTAPEARLVGLRLIAAPTTDADEADAIAWNQDLIHIKSNSWGPFDNAYGAGGPGPLSLAAMEAAVTTGRGGLGTIFLWAAGNGNGSGDDSNYDGWANWPHAIAVSAINDKGRPSWYSEPGANILVCAPSSGRQGITTTDRRGKAGYNTEGGTFEYPDHDDLDYTNGFGGTSSSTPAVAGVVALMLQANPNLSYRDVQEILVRTATQNDEFSGGWVKNGAGFHFHHHYGAGLVNATAATNLAANWTSVAPLQTRSQTQTELALAIPDADPQGVTRSFTVAAADNLRLEHVTVKVKVTHPYVGNLEWRLISPSGGTSRLARARFNDSSANLEWTFMSTHFWGERSQGEWKLEVVDRRVDHVGTLDEVTLTFYGTPAPAPLPLPVITSPWIIVGREGWKMEGQVTASNFASDFQAGTFGTGLPPAGLAVDPFTGVISGMPQQTGLFEGYQSAINATGTGAEFAYFYILAAEPQLAEAVEQPPETKIIPFGFGDPFRQTVTSFDGVDAIETAAVDHEEYSGIEFTVDGPARLQFRWKVSSERFYDYLVLVIDGVVRDYLTGEVDWLLSSTDLGPGPHNVDIYYVKDQAEVRGQDRGWIDQVVITPINDPPEVQVETIAAYAGQYFRHSLVANHAPTSFAVEGLPPGLTLHAPSGLIYGQVETVGSYPIVVHATNEFGTGTETLVIEVGSIELGLAEALDVPQQTVTTSGDLPWLPNWLYTRDGEDAARSGDIDNLQQSVMTTEVTGPCKLTFYWGVSSEKDYDFLRFFIDDEEKAAISGEVGWTRQEHFIPAGTHSLKWVYQKDDYVARGLDSGFVDQLETHVDADGDGYYADVEEWFGTSDTDPASQPIPRASRTAEGMRLDFPSVPGNDYRIEFSEDLVKWSATLFHATNTQSSWIDRNLKTRQKRFYRVLIP
jgi:subtilisin-like proprotein convertase family protein